MRRKYRLLFFLLILILSVGVFAACSGKTSKKDEKVTLKMLIAVSEEDFKNRFKDQIDEAFPDINLELMPGAPSDPAFLEELFAKGEMPDIITVGPTKEYIEELDVLMPIDNLIAKHNFDLSIFRDGIVEDLRAYDPMGEGNLYGLPIEIGLTAMYYNKDIFDMFGEDYPTDGMTWDEVVDLARKLTQERDGIQYKGLGLLSWAANIPYRQLSIPGTDPETGEVLFADDPRTRKYFELLDEIRSIPGMQITDEDNPDGFHTGRQNIAMWVASAPYLPILAPTEGFNFDMVTTPEWSDHSNIGPSQVALSFNITKHSEHPDEAFKVIAHLASVEGQKVLSRAGSPPTIKDESVFDEFGALAIEQFGKEYNARAPFIQTLAPVTPFSKYDEGLLGFITAKTNEFLASDQDANTFIREMKEEYEARVAEMKGRN